MIFIDYNNLTTIRYSTALNLVITKEEKTAYKKHGVLPDYDNNWYSTLKKAFHNLMLNELEGISKRYKRDYGEVVVCCDYDKKNYWRKQIFSPYKEGRDNLKSNPFDEMSGKMNYEHKRELKEILKLIGVKLIDEVTAPFMNNPIASAEADEIIGVLCYEIPGKHLTVSNDGDYNQMCVRSNIRIYDPFKRKLKVLTKKEINEKNIMSCLLGQSKDSIYGIKTNSEISDDFIKWMNDNHQIEITKSMIYTMSRDYPKYMEDYRIEKSKEDDKSIKEGKRKKRRYLTAYAKANFAEGKAKPLLEEYGLEKILEMNPMYKARYELNERLYYLDKTPQEIKDAILGKFNNYIVKEKDDYAIQLYFMQHGLKQVDI